MILVECTKNYRTLEPLMDVLPGYRKHNHTAMLYFHEGMIQVVRRITAEEMVMHGDPKYPNWNIPIIEVGLDAVLIPLFHAGIKEVSHEDIPFDPEKHLRPMDTKPNIKDYVSDAF